MFQQLRKIEANLKFSTKLILAMSVLVLCSFFLSVTLFIYHTRQSAMANAEKRGTTLVNNLVANSELGVLAKDDRFMKKPIESIFQEEDIIYVMVYDLQQNLLAVRNRIEPELKLPAKYLKGQKQAALQKYIRSVHGEQVYEFIAPIKTFEVSNQTDISIYDSETGVFAEPALPGAGFVQERTIGYARLGISLKNIRQEIQKIITNGIFIAVILFILSLIATYTLVQILTRPIATLTKGVQAVRDGDLDRRIQVTAQNEFAELAVAFNEMSDTVKNTMRDIMHKNEELENFVHTVSHDLKAPLISIQGFSGIMQRKYKSSLDEKGQFYLERINRNVEQMDQLIHDLLELSKISRVGASFEQVAVKEVLEEVINELYQQLTAKQIKLITQAELPMVYFDNTRLKQIFRNLITNAIKFFGSQPTPRIEVSAKEFSGYHEFCVKDNGIGIDSKYQAKIFGLFQRLEDIKDAPGTGVGLTIVKRILDDCDGRIRLESAPGEGTAFYFTIPRFDPGHLS